jgi:hypothetical protein
MYLTSCQTQKQTLEEFYAEVMHWEQDRHREIGTLMLALIARLRALPNSRRAFGVTSHLRLCLLAQDDWKSPPYVTISIMDRHNYFVDYLMPARIAPWPNASVHGEAHSEDEALRMIDIAMANSEGWPAE